MAVAHQVADQPGIVPRLLGPGAVRDARRLHDGGIVAHVVDDADKTVIEHRYRLIKAFFQPRRDGAARGLRLGAGGLDLGFLLLGQGHGRFLCYHWPKQD